MRICSSYFRGLVRAAPAHPRKRVLAARQIYLSGKFPGSCKNCWQEPWGTYRMKLLSNHFGSHFAGGLSEIYSGLQFAKSGGKGPRQKTSKIVKKMFRHFSTIFAQGKKCQKSSNSVKKFVDNFRAAPFFRPLLGGSDPMAMGRGNIGSSIN